jgi:AcrR family transcriptional regulator
MRGKRKAPKTLGPNIIGGAHHPSLLQVELTTDRQRQRRARILDAAVEVAGAGDYELVHMRDVAGRAEVSLATLYHHFPSKVHLLVRALERELLRFDDCLGQDLVGVSDPLPDCASSCGAQWRSWRDLDESPRRLATHT